MNRTCNVKSLARLAAIFWLFGAVAISAPAAFTSFYVFGDGVSTSTNASGGTYYYGKRYCNGRVWVEVLAERQGLACDTNKNWSYFGHYSPNLVTNINNFIAPPDANTALFVVWVNNADFVYNMSNYAPYTTNNLTAWTNAIHRSLTNHLQAVQTLYAKGARTLIMPNAVDITKVPLYVAYSADSKSFIRQRIIDFNIGFTAMLNQAGASLPGLTIHVPDLFGFLDNLVARSADYGLTNVLDDRGLSVDAVNDTSLADKSLNGPGANYLFWDDLNPTARAGAVMADNVQQFISPPQISSITSLNGSNRLDAANIPIGRNGFVEASATLVAWTTETNFVSASATQVIVVPASGPQRFYRLRFPFTWSWP